MWQKLKNIYHLLTSFLAAYYFGFPSKKLTVIGVTGTDGKTTTVSMIYHVLKTAGKKVSLISSVFASIGNKTYNTGFHVTTPNPWALQSYLAKAVQKKSDYFILEATSHGLDQNRVANIAFKVAVITNITHEHLDYHKTWQNYADAKAKLFKNAQFSVLNYDDKSYEFLKKRIRGKIVTYSFWQNSDFNLKNTPLKLKLLGDFNLANALAALSATSCLGVPKAKATQALKNFSGVKGRLEEVNLGQKFKVYVDFAHTPNALKEVLSTLKSQLENKGRLIAVFGAAGKRDFTKREKMGEVAAKVSNVTVITAEDPRTEKIENICAQIAKGLAKNGKKEGRDYFQIYDREKAIEAAIKMAKVGDIVGTFGKSHEKSMCYGTKEYPWDEFEAVNKALRKVLQ